MFDDLTNVLEECIDFSLMLACFFFFLGGVLYSDISSQRRQEHLKED